MLRALKPIYINVGSETHVHKITNAPVFLMEGEVMDFWREICITWASWWALNSRLFWAHPYNWPS
jgi:hypothetical protein